jgi:outer membrane protein
MKTFLLTGVSLFLTVLSTFSPNAAHAQRFALADSEYILKHIPEYISAQKELNSLSQQWQKEMDKRQMEIDNLSKAFRADQPLLTDEMKKHREDEISGKEKDLQMYQNTKFGVEGELFQLRVKLITPIQDRVAKATQFIAESQQLDIIFDKAAYPPLYLTPRYDKSDDIIKRLGYKPGAFAE